MTEIHHIFICSLEDYGEDVQGELGDCREVCPGEAWAGTSDEEVQWDIQLNSVRGLKP